MKTKSGLILYFLFLFLSGTFYTPCTQQLVKEEAIPSKISETANLKSVDNFLQEAFLSYQQEQLTEVTQKLEAAVNLVHRDSPTSSVVTLYTMLAFFQEKSGDSLKADTTFKVVQGLFQKLSNMPSESEVLAWKLIQFALQLKVQDRLQFWEWLRPVASASHGKAGEAGIIWQVSEAYLAINNYHEAYERGKEALQLARDSGQLWIEVRVSISISRSLIGLGRFQEVEDPLQEVLPKTEKDPLLKALILGARGTVYWAIGRWNLAVQDLQEGISLARSLGDPNLLARLQSDLGNVYLSIGKGQEAIQVLLEAINHFEKKNDELSIANTEAIIAQTYFEMGSFGEANQHASRAAEIYNRLGNRIEEAKNLRTVGQSLAELKKVDEALQVLQKATDIQVDKKNLDEASKTYWWTIGLLKRLGRIEDVKQSLLTALNANAEIFKDKKVEAQIRNELAKVYRESGLFSEALKQFGIALTLHKELSDRKSEVVTLLKIADTFANLKDYENRIGALILAEQLGTKLNDQHLQALILVYFAEAFRDFGDTVEALQKYLEAIETSHQASKENEIFPLIAISEFYMDWMDEYTKALHYLEKALTLAKEIGDRESEGNILLGIGRAYLKMGRSEDAVRLSRDALMIIRATKAEKLLYETFALEYLGLALINQGLYDSAFEVYQECLQIAMQSGSASQIQRAYNGLGYVSLQMGKYVEAVEAYKNSITWIEGLRSEIIGEKYKIVFFEKKLSPYEGIVEALYHLYVSGDPEKNRLAKEALHFAELSKARSWTDQLSMARLRFIEETVAQEVRKKEEDALNQFLTARKAYTSASSRYRIPEEELQEEENAWEVAQKKWEDFVEELYKKYPQYVTLRYPLARRRYPEDSFRKTAIREGETLIVYNLTPDWAYAWVLSKIGGRNEILKFIRLPVKTKDIEKLAEKFLAPFRMVKYERFASDIAAELFRAILWPVFEGVESSRRLIIVPDGILNVIPFEALVTEMAGGNKGPKTPCFLFDRFNISYYPSTAVLTINRQTVPKNLPTKGTILAVGDPVYGPGDERLAPSQVSLLREIEQRQGATNLTLRGKIRRGAQDQGYTFERIKHSGVEVLKISELFRNMRGPRDVLIGFEASKERVKSKDLTQYQYLHFAVHGILSYEVPYLKEPALILAIDPASKEDGFLRLSEIYGLKLNSDLVTLSACKTGLGDRISGEGVIGLSRAFMNAGARAVVVSLWEVDDQSTGIFMEEFYRLLTQGIDKVEALKMAKEYLRKKGYENPYFWAPFILIGD